MEKVIDKIWGLEEWVKVTDNYAVKILTLDVGKHISYQLHEIKEESWYILSGEGAAQVDSNLFNVEQGNFIHIAPNTPHIIKAITPLKILEVSSNYLEDLVRLDGEVAPCLLVK